MSTAFLVFEKVQGYPDYPLKRYHEEVDGEARDECFLVAREARDEGKKDLERVNREVERVNREVERVNREVERR